MKTRQPAGVGDYLRMTRGERKMEKQLAKVAQELHPEAERQRHLGRDALGATVALTVGVGAQAAGLDPVVGAGLAATGLSAVLALVHAAVPSRMMEPSSLDGVRKLFDAERSGEQKAVILGMMERIASERTTPLPPAAQQTWASMLAEVSQLPPEVQARGKRIGAVYGAFGGDAMTEDRAREVADRFAALPPEEQEQARPLLYKTLHQTFTTAPNRDPNVYSLLFATLTPPDVAELQLQNLLQQVEWSAAPSSVGGKTLAKEEAVRIADALQGLPDAERAAAKGRLQSLLFSSPGGEPSRPMDASAEFLLRSALGL